MRSKHVLRLYWTMYGLTKWLAPTVFDTDHVVEFVNFVNF